MPGWRYAFSLPSEAVKAATPPGTVLLIEHSITLQDGRYVDRVVKYPLPTFDQADPLNWQPWRKAACMAAVSLYAFVSNFISASIAPALPVWNLSFPHDPRPLKDLMGFVAFNVLVLGLCNIFWVPLSNIFGRRPVLVLSTIILFVATACGTTLAGYNTTLIIRIFQGLGSSASETVTPAVVGDLFFVHERGSWMAFYTASLASGSVVGGITGGYIATRLGWFKVFEVGAALTGLAFLCVVFLVPETIYDRGQHSLPIQRTLPRPSRYMPPTPPPILTLDALPSFRLTLPSKFRWRFSAADPRMTLAGMPPDGMVPAGMPPAGMVPAGMAPAGMAPAGMTWYQGSSSGDLGSSSSAATPSRRLTKYEPVSRFSPATATSSEPGPPFTFAQSLKFGTYKGNVWYQFKKPWCTLRLPATWVIMMQYGGLVGGIAVISTVGPQILAFPPYEWGPHTGLLFLGALIGIILGGLCTAWMADSRLKKLAKDQDHGYAEPESRIAVMLPALAIGTGGLLLFGFCAQYPGGSRWVGLEVAYGMVAFALAQVPSIWFNYLIDSYNQLASDCFVMICILRGVIPFAWTFFVDQWVQRDGYLIPFGSFTAVLGVFSLLAVPLIYWGKRMRIATARYVVANQ